MPLDEIRAGWRVYNGQGFQGHRCRRGHGDDSALAERLRRKLGTAPLSAPVSPDLVSGLLSVARSRRARSMWFRRRHLRRSITAQWRTDRRHGRQAGMTTVRGAIRASTRKRDISWGRTGHPISAARAGRSIQGRWNGWPPGRGRGAPSIEKPLYLTMKLLALLSHPFHCGRAQGSPFRAVVKQHADFFEQ